MKIHSKAVFVFACLTISGHSMAGFLDKALSKVNETVTEANTYMGNEPKENAPSVWASEPLLTAENCDNLTWENVASFNEKYSQPVDEADPMDKASEKAKNTYTLAAAVINRSNLCTAESLGLKQTMDNLLLEREVLLSGTSLSDEQIKQHRVYSEQANREIRDKLAQTKAVEPQQKKTMALSFGMFFLGSYLTYELKGRVEKLSKEVSKKKKTSLNSFKEGNLFGGLADAGNTLTGGLDMVNLATVLPGHVTDVSITGVDLHKFAISNDIVVPNDATRYYTQTTGEAW